MCSGCGHWLEAGELTVSATLLSSRLQGPRRKRPKWGHHQIQTQARLFHGFDCLCGAVAVRLIAVAFIQTYYRGLTCAGSAGSYQRPATASLVLRQFPAGPTRHGDALAAGKSPLPLSGTYFAKQRSSSDLCKDAGRVNHIPIHCHRPCEQNFCHAIVALDNKVRIDAPPAQCATATSQ